MSGSGSRAVRRDDHTAFTPAEVAADRANAWSAFFRARIVPYEALRPWKERARGFADMEQVWADNERELHAALDTFFRGGDPPW